MDTFPELHTARLRLRKISIDDVPLLIRYANNKKIADYILNIPHPYGEPDAVFRIGYVVQGFKNRSRYVFAIVLKERDELIGEISLHLSDDRRRAQLGYWVGEPFWNTGIATEAVAAILPFGFDILNLLEVQATCHAENRASWKVLEHNGMVQRLATGSILQYSFTGQEYKTRTAGED